MQWEIVLLLPGLFGEPRCAGTCMHVGETKRGLLGILHALVALPYILFP